ncbi:GGDEF domain-containing protein [Alkalispirochaeta alkalica]|uniref:GGDEF domain-containing protein n=1 Tax=Alkalispirochaeta alkalica TaxID=46356 RepID=UPI00036C928B|nr:sensor domain-containing diguanylate cyclase [Alkalispirochaeta alkalica]
MASAQNTATEDLIRLSFFTDMARDIAAATTLEETLQQVMKHIGAVFAPRNWSLLLKDNQTGEMVFAIAIGGENVAALRGKRLPPGTGIVGWIAENRQPLIIEDVSRDPRFDASIDELTKFRTKSIIGVPLITRNRVFGVIELINKVNGEAFTALDMKVLCTIADFAAIAIEKAYYFRALRRAALEDSLTGLQNRRSLSRTLEREIRRCSRTGAPLAALLIDLDRFKAINDSWGHAAGDMVLQHLASILKESVRETDVVSRYGGDEFIVVMPETDQSGAREARRRLEEALERGKGQAPVPYSVSIGVYSGRPTSPEDLFQGADIHLYSEKDRKRDAHLDEMAEHIIEFMDEATCARECSS